MSAPAGPEELEAAVAVGRRQVDSEERPELPVEVAERALGPLHHADDHVIAETGESRLEELEQFGLAEAMLAAEQGEAAVHHERLDAVEEALGERRVPEVIDGDAGHEGVVLEAVSGPEILVSDHELSLSLGLMNGGFKSRSSLGR